MGLTSDITGWANREALSNPIFTSVILVYLIVCVMYTMFSFYKFVYHMIFPATTVSPFGSLLNMGAGAISLDPYTGTCLSGAGHDIGKNGGCGAAEPFTAKSHTRFATARQNAMQRITGTSGFLNTRGDGPEFNMNSQADADYWSNELSTPSGMTDAGADAVTGAMDAATAAAQTVAAVQSGAVSAQQAPAVAAAVASRFAAQRATKYTSSDDALSMIAMGHR